MTWSKALGQLFLIAVSCVILAAVFDFPFEHTYFYALGYVSCLIINIIDSKT